jgi:hypothetical protein
MYFKLLSVFLLINEINCQYIKRPSIETEENEYALNIKSTYKTTSHDLVNYLESLLESNKESSHLLPIKEKKNNYHSSIKYENDISETEPLSSHHRKNYFKINDQNILQSCETKIAIEANKIIDSKTSTEKGAIILSIERVFSESSSLVELQNACITKCCNNGFCDNALLSLKKSSVIYHILFLFIDSIFFNFT